MKIAFIGSGQVGTALADGLQRRGHDIVLATGRDGSASVQRARARNPLFGVDTKAAAVLGADLVFLATPFSAVEDALGDIRSELRGKVLVDCTNPVGPGLRHGLASERSGAEHIQALVPDAKVVKAFTIYGFENLEDASYPSYGCRPAMLFCGDDAGAKAVVGARIEELGFEAVDVGRLPQALHLEHMTLLWVTMVRAGEHPPDLVWGALRRSSRAAGR